MADTERVAEALCALSRKGNRDSLNSRDCARQEHSVYFAQTILTLSKNIHKPGMLSYLIQVSLM